MKPECPHCRKPLPTPPQKFCGSCGKVVISTPAMPKIQKSSPPKDSASSTPEETSSQNGEAPPSGEAPLPNRPPDGALPLAQERILAAFIDALVGGAIAMIFYGMGFILGFIPMIGGLMGMVTNTIGMAVGAYYILARDYIEFGPLKGRSFGKQVRKIAALPQTGQPLDFMGSMKRNLPLAIGFLCGILLAPVQFLVGSFPILKGFASIFLLFGMLAIALVQLSLLMVEVYHILNMPDGIRLGDRWAETRTDFKL